MNAVTPLPTRPDPPTRPRWNAAAIARYGVLTAVAVLFWLISLEFPSSPAPYLDTSWQTALVHAHEQHLVYGRDLIFSAGPLGFLTSQYVLPGSLELKLGWEIFGKLILVLVVVVSAASLPRWRRAWFLVAALLFSRGFPDTLQTLVVALLVLQWVLPRASSPVRLGMALVVLALLAQFKFTLLLLGAGGVALAALRTAGQRDWRRALAIGGGFGFAFLAWWRIAGQPFSALPAYVRTSLDFSSGYPWAMGLDEPLGVFFAGVAAVVFVAVVTWTLARHARGDECWDVWPVALFLGAFWFIAWKHGFTRGDGHTNGFFFICLLVGLALPGLVASRLRRWWFDGIVPICLLGIVLTDANVMPRLLPGIRDRFNDARHYVVNLQEVRDQFHATAGRYRIDQDLPKLRAAVNQSTVDLLNFEQGLLFINGLNYHPRPVVQGYAAYTSALIRANAAFFAGPRAPEFVVVRFNTIDHRYPTMDDALVLAELPLRYDVVYVDADHVLWQKNPKAHPTAALTRETLLEQPAPLGQEIILPADRTHALWLQLDIKPTFVGQLRAFFYKPGELKIVVTDEDGRESRFRLVPTSAREGFLLQPFLESFTDYALFAKGQGRQWLRSIRFEPATPDQRELWRSVDLRLSRMAELPLKRVDASAQPAVRFSNLVPLEIKTDLEPIYFRIGADNAALVHAASLVAFAPPAGTKNLRGGFGLAEGSYLGNGDTDGAEFSIEVVHANGTNEVIWLERLAPKTKEADRGTHRFEIALPADAARVLMRTTQGPSGKGDWDWTYWTQLEFSP